MCRLHPLKTTASVMGQIHHCRLVVSKPMLTTQVQMRKTHNAGMHRETLDCTSLLGCDRRKESVVRDVREEISSVEQTSQELKTKEKKKRDARLRKEGHPSQIRSSS